MNLPKFQFDQKFPRLKRSKIIDGIEYIAEIQYYISGIFFIKSEDQYIYALVPIESCIISNNRIDLPEKEMEEFISNPESFIKRGPKN